MKPKNSIDEALGLPTYHEEDIVNSLSPPIEAEFTEVSVSDRKTMSDSELIEELESIKANINTIVTQGSDSLEDIIELAKQSENPRAFEVAATIMKALLEANRDLVSIAEKKDVAKKIPSNTNETNVTNNILNISTAELLKMVNGSKK